MALDKYEQDKINKIAKRHVLAGRLKAYLSKKNINSIAAILNLPRQDFLHSVDWDQKGFDAYRQSHPKLILAYKFLFEKYELYERQQLAIGNTLEDRQQ